MYDFNDFEVGFSDPTTRIMKKKKPISMKEERKYDLTWIQEMVDSFVLISGKGKDKRQGNGRRILYGCVKKKTKKTKIKAFTIPTTKKKKKKKEAFVRKGN